MAAFVGRSTAFEARCEADGRASLARGEGGRAVWRVARWTPEAVGRPVELLARPEGLALLTPGAADGLPGKVVDRRYAGPLTYYTVALAGGVEAEVLAAPDAAREGDEVAVAPMAEGALPWLFSAGGSGAEG